MKYFCLCVMSLFLVACIGIGDCKCSLVDCGTHGTCGEDCQSCVCVVGYQTDFQGRCDSLSKEKFMGTYLVARTCTNGNYQDTIQIVSDIGFPDGVIIQHFGGYDSLFVAAKIADKTLHISGLTSPVSQKEYEVSSTRGIFDHNTFTLQYQITIDGILAADCTGSYTKL